MPAVLGDDLVAMLPRMRRFALALARNRDEADDLVQAACERALRAQDSFAPGTRLDAWVFRIIRNLWLDRMRRQTTRGVEVLVEDEPDLADPRASSIAETRLFLSEVWRYMEELPDHQREVLVLVCVEHLSYREAAEVLEIPIGTLMSRLKRARRKIAELVGLNDVTERSPYIEGTSP